MFRQMISTLCCLAAPALAAACPTAADLDGGIRLLSPNDEVETFTRHNDAIVRGEFYFEEGEGARSLLAQGLYLIELVDIVAGKPDLKSRVTYSFPLQPGDMPVPTPGGVWAPKVASLDADGLTSEPYDIRFEDQTSMTIGACTYDMVPVTIDYPEDDTYSETLFYLVDLGIALLGETRDKGQDPERYIYTGIEAVTP